MIDFSQVRTAAQVEADALDVARVAARADLVAWVDAVTFSITGAVPADEKLSWTYKATAGRALLAETATADQEALIASEAAITGEAVVELAQKIVGNADAYAAAISELSGLRRIGFAGIDAATTPAEVAGAVASAKAMWPSGGVA